MKLLLNADDCHFYMLEDELLFMQVKKTHIDTATIVKLIEHRKALVSEYSLTHVIVDHSQVLKMDPEARKISHKEETYENINSLAFIGNNPISIFGFNVLINIKPANIPMKGFTKLEPAIIWSEKQKNLLQIDLMEITA